MPNPLKVEDLFGGSQARMTPAQMSQAHDEFMTALATSKTVSVGPDKMPHLNGGFGIDFDAPVQPSNPLAALMAAAARPEITKAMAPDQLQSLTTALDALKGQLPDLVKDITTSSPVSGGLVAYDLEAPAKMLTPKPMPLRNRIPRKKGIGLNRQYKRITGFTGTGTGGVGVIRPGITDATQTNFANPGSSNNLFYNRGPKISYAGDQATVPYIQFSLSDELSWSTQFSGQGYQDIRTLSRQSLLWASMLMEERILLYGRGTQAGFSGVLAAPTGVAGAARSAVAGETGISGATTNLFVRVVAEMGDLGVSQATAVSAAIAVSNGQVVDVTYTLPAGATGARVFVATGASDPGDAARWLYTFTGGGVFNGRSGYNKLTIQGALPTSGTVPTSWPLSAGGTANLTSADGGSAVAQEYDGVLAYCTGANAGYTTKLNGLFSTTNPGVEYQTAFASMYDAVKASPDRIMFNGRDRKQLSDAVKGASNSNYQIKLAQDDINGYTLGTLATAILNEVTGDQVNLEVHPWLPQGNSAIISDSLPIPDTNVDSVFSVVNVQDMMGVDWPVNQFSYDSSSYWFGALVCYAPAWLGSVVGIQAG